MTTLRSKQRVLALCALIAEEKDLGKFAVLVSELNDAFENDERKVEHAGRTAKVSYISSPAASTQRV